MLEVLDDIICSSIMVVTQIYIVRKIVNNNDKNYINILFGTIIFLLFSIFLHPIQYEPIYSISILLLNIALNKKLFKLTLEQSTIASCLYIVVLSVSDITITTILRQFYSQELIRADALISIMANLAISTLSITLINNKKIFNKIQNLYNAAKTKIFIINILYLMLLAVGFFYILYNIGTHTINQNDYIANLIIVGVLVIITYIYIESRTDYKQLSDEYDTLFTYVQNFEDWIEKEQLNRHEYKNQLAIIRGLTKDKKVISKIEEILSDNINIKGDVVHKLKELPKGGLKGLLYYKVAIAQKNNLNIEVDVSFRNNKNLESLTEEQLKVLCKLIGIYFDNAIEAAIETEEKILSLEIYSIKQNLNIVLANTYKEHQNFSNRNEKGVTSKGEGHGNGLYYANNLLKKNKWLESKQEIKDNYYFQTMIIKN